MEYLKLVIMACQISSGGSPLPTLAMQQACIEKYTTCSVRYTKKQAKSPADTFAYCNREVVTDLSESLKVK